MLAKWLYGKGHKARALHGDMAQAARTETLEAFKAGEIVLLICSDVAARGIDVESLSHVFNYDVPFNPDDYVHRIGRTGRAGQTGRAWMLVTEDDEKLLAAVIKRIGQDVESVEIGKPGKPLPKQKPKKTQKKNADDDSGDVTGFGDDMPSFFRV